MKPLHYLLSIGILLAVNLSVGHGATLTWTNTAGGVWGAAVNWTPNQVPGPSDDVIVTASGTYEVGLNGSEAANSLTVGGSAGLQTVSLNGQSLTIGSAAIFGALGSLNFNGGSLAGAGTLTMSGSNYWSGGYWSNQGLNEITAAGQLVIDTGSDHNLPNTVWNNLGTVTHTGGTVRGGNTAITNSAMWLEQTDNQFNNAYAGFGAMEFYNLGAFRKTVTGGTATVFAHAAYLINTGTVDAQSGLIEVADGGGSSSGGIFNAAFTAQIDFGSTYTFTGQNDFSGDGTISWNGIMNINGTINSANLEWQSGYIAGTATNAAGSTLYLTTGNDHNLPNTVLYNLGQIAHKGGTVRGGNSLISNSGTWLEQIDDQFNDAYAGYGVTTFANLGTFIKNTTTGTSYFLNAAFLLNSGLVDVQTGTLQISDNGGSSTGIFQAESGAEITFDSNNYTFENGASFVGAGNILLDSGGVTFAGTFTTTNLQWVGAQIAGTPTNVPGNVLYIVGGNDHNMPNVTFNNLGTVLWQGGAIRGGNTLIYNNRNWLVQTDNQINNAYAGWGSLWFYNNNLLRKTTTGGNTVFANGAFLINGSLVDTQTGQLVIDDGGGTNFSTGIFNTGPSGTNNFISTYTFADGTAFNGTGLNIFNGGYYIFQGRFTSPNGLVWYSGQIAGTVVNTLSSTLNIVSGNDHNMPSVTFTNLGLIAHTGGGNVRGGGTILKNNGLWLEQTDGQINNAYAGYGSLEFYNTGIFRKTATSGGNTTFAPGAHLVNSGIIDDESGLIEIVDGGGSSASGTFNVAAGAQIDFGSVYTFNAENNFMGDGVVSWNGTMNLNGTINSANVQWQSGYITGNGTNPVGSTIFVTSGNDHNMPTASLYNLGHIVHTGAGNVRGGGSLISNSGTWFEQTDAALNDDYAGYGYATFANMGTFVKNTTSGQSSFPNGARLINSGLVDIQSGSLVVADGGGSNTGTFQTGPGAVCTWTSTYTFNTGSQFLGAGLNSLQGTAIFTGNFFSANLEWDSGSYIGPGTNLAGSTFVIKTGNDHNMPDQTLCNLGTIIHKDGNIRGGGSTIVNSGTWQEESDKQINDDYSGYGSFSFINNGLFHRVGDNGSTTFTAGTALANNGTLTVENGSVICNGSYTHNNGALNFGLSSSSPAVYGSLGLSGPVTFNGTLAIHLLGGYTPLLGDTFTVISYPSYSGNFANLNLSPVPAGDMWQVNYNAANVVLKVVSPGATGPQIVGTVKDAPTHGVAGITVAAFTTGNPSIYTSTTTDGAGNYTVGVTNGDWVVGLENLAAAGFNPVPDQAAVVSAPKTEVDFLVQVTGATTPGAVTAAATSITAGGATLNGTATPNGETVSVYYNYGLSSAYGQSTSTNTITANLNTSQAQPMIVTGLAAGTLYHFQLVVVNSMGNAGGGDLTFTTASAPVVITAAATDIGATNATFNGSINPKGLASAWYFEYGTDLNYGSYSATSSIPAGLAFLVATNECTNLAPATVYHFQLVGANSSGTNFGGDFMLTTDPTAPYVTTVAASSVTASSATLNASVNPNGKQTMAYIEYGLDATYGSFTPTNTFAAGSVAQAMPQPLAGGLAANQTYHFRAVGWNSLGTNQGADMTFATGTIAPEIQCPLDITANSAPGQCQQTLAFAATVTAGSPAPVVTYQLNGSEITSPYSFPVGQSVVSVTATNVAGTNSCSFMVTVVDDQLPIPGPNQMGVSQGAPAAVDVAKMLLSCSSPSGQPLHITSVTSPTVGHASVAIQGGQIVYSNIFIGTDVLNYTLSDGCGTATGTIMVQVLSTNLPSLNQVSLTPGSTGMTVVFNGVPGVTYIVQSSPSASGPWSDLSGQIQANGIGLVQYTDSSSSPTGFYRTRVVGH